MALDIIFLILVHFYLARSIYPFPVDTAQFIGEFWTDRRSAASDVVPTVLLLFRNVIGATLHPALKGEAGHLRRANRQSAANLQCQLEVFADFFIRCASPTGGVQIAAAIVLAQLKGNERIGEERTPIPALRLLL